MPCERSCDTKRRLRSMARGCGMIGVSVDDLRVLFGECQLQQVKIRNFREGEAAGAKNSFFGSSEARLQLGSNGNMVEFDENSASSVGASDSLRCQECGRSCNPHEQTLFEQQAEKQQSQRATTSGSAAFYCSDCRMRTMAHMSALVSSTQVECSNEEGELSPPTFRKAKNGRPTTTTEESSSNAENSGCSNNSGENVPQRQHQTTTTSGNGGSNSSSSNDDELLQFWNDYSKNEQEEEEESRENLLSARRRRVCGRSSKAFVINSNSGGSEEEGAGGVIVLGPATASTLRKIARMRRAAARMGSKKNSSNGVTGGGGGGVRRPPPLAQFSSTLRGGGEGYYYSSSCGSEEEENSSSGSGGGIARKRSNDWRRRMFSSSIDCSRTASNGSAVGSVFSSFSSDQDKSDAGAAAFFNSTNLCLSVRPCSAESSSCSTQSTLQMGVHYDEAEEILDDAESIVPIASVKSRTGPALAASSSTASASTVSNNNNPAAAAAAAANDDDDMIDEQALLDSMLSPVRCVAISCLSSFDDSSILVSDPMPEPCAPRHRRRGGGRGRNGDDGDDTMDDGELLWD